MPEILMGVGSLTLMGGGAMYALRGGTMYALRDRPKAKSDKETEEKEDIRAAAPSKRAGEGAVTHKYEVFGVPTHYLREQTPIYLHLHNLSTYLQFKPERDAFGGLVHHIDNIEGFTKLVKAKDRKLSNIAAVPFAASEAFKAAEAALTLVIEEQDRARESETKRASMEDIGHSITAMLKKAVHNIRMEIASCPIEVTTM